MKSVGKDGGECWRKWYQTRHAHLLSLSGPPPKDLCANELQLTAGCRYAQRLLKNGRILRYLGRNHPVQLRTLQTLLAAFNRNL
jgi:hypothetical protein